MKRVLLLAVLLMFMGTIAVAETCIGMKNAVAYRSMDDYAFSIKSAMNADEDQFYRVLGAMIKEGRAIEISGVILSGVEDNFLVATGYLPNGLKVWVMPYQLRCK